MSYARIFFVAASIKLIEGCTLTCAHASARATKL
jgi:hypothetical protein